MADRLEEREIRVAVGVRRARGEVEPLSSRKLLDAIRLGLSVERPQGSSGVATVAHLADRAERAIEAQIVRDALDDLLQRRRHDVHALTALAVLLDQAK